MPPRCAGSATALATRLTESSTSIAGKWPFCASFRSRITCPSSVPRAASATGSVMSSPSTRIVYSPVIEPAFAPPGPATAPRTLEQHRQLGEDARRVAPRRGRLAHAQPHLPAGVGKAGDRVHHQQHVEPVVAEALGDRAGELGGPQPHQRRLVARGHDQHRPRESALAQALVQKLGDLSAPLAEQCDDADIGVGAAGDLPEQRALADARAREDAQPLALADRRHQVDRAHPGQQVLGHAGPSERARSARATTHGDAGRARGPARRSARRARSQPGPSCPHPSARPGGIRAAGRAGRAGSPRHRRRSSRPTTSRGTP